MKKNNDNNLALWLSKETGISLRRLAQWLQTLPSQLTRWGQGTRPLQSASLMQLIEAWKSLSTLPEPTMQHTPNKQEAVIFQHMALEWDMKAKEADRQLQYHLQRYRQALRAIQWLETLHQKNKPATSKCERWIEENLYMAQKKLQQHGPTVCKPLEIAHDMYSMAAARFAELGGAPAGED